MNKKSIELSNGEVYSYIERGQGKETIILIHGNMSSGVHYKPLIELLENKYHMIAPDLRGFGDSSYHKSIESLEDLTDDISLFMDALNIDKAHLVGWSTGGAVILKLAAKYPEMVGKIVLLESASYRGYPIFKKDEAGNPQVGEYYLSKDDMALDPVQVLPMVTALENNDINTIKAVWDMLIYNVSKPNQQDDALFLSETMKQRNIVDIDWCLTKFNMSNFTNGVTGGDNSIENVKSQVLSIWSESDLVVLESMVDETVEALANVQKVVLKSSGHSPLVDCPQELANLFRDFIK